MAALAPPGSIVCCPLVQPSALNPREHQKCSSLHCYPRALRPHHGPACVCSAHRPLPGWCLANTRGGATTTPEQSAMQRSSTLHCCTVPQRTSTHPPHTTVVAHYYWLPASWRSWCLLSCQHNSAFRLHTQEEVTKKGSCNFSTSFAAAATTTRASRCSCVTGGAALHLKQWCPPPRATSATHWCFMRRRRCYLQLISILSWV